MAQETISFSDKVDGWTSFHSFIPDGMASINNRFISIKNGQLWLHNDEINLVRNNFYGEQFDSKIVTVINEANSEDKIFKTLVLEGNNSWEANIKTNYTESNILKSEFNKRESRYFAHIRKHEDNNDFHGETAQGIGNILSVSGNVITYSNVSSNVNIGDRLFQLNGSINELIGMVSDYSATTITVTTILITPVVGLFSFSGKEGRIEGAEIRGYFAEITLVNDDTTATELFAIESNIIKSFV